MLLLAVAVVWVAATRGGPDDPGVRRQASPSDDQLGEPAAGTALPAGSTPASVRSLPQRGLPGSVPSNELGAVDPQVSSFEKTCAERLKAAPMDSPEQHTAQRECASRGPYQGVPFASDVGNETTTYDAAVTWWTVSSVLRSREPRDEAVIVTTRDGMSRTDPAAAVAALTFVYQRPPTLVSNATYFALIEAGARTVRVVHFPAGVRFDPRSIQDGKPVMVRGTHAAFVDRLEKGSGSNADWLTIRWMERPRQAGGVILRELGFDPRSTTDDEAVEFANSLVEV